MSGKENSADLSRGLSPQRLQQEQFWWKEPRWLRNHSISWPSRIPNLDTTRDLEERSAICTMAVENSEPELRTLIENYSSLTSLLRIIAWLLRARNRLCKTATVHSAYLSPAELDSTLMFWTKLTQQAYFSQDIRILKSQGQLAKSSSLLHLAPIFDAEGLLRLRGCLQHAQLEPSEKHPLLILPRSSRMTILVIDHHHKRTLHGGPQLTLSSIRQKLWIIGGRVPIRSFIHTCVTCARQHVVAAQQIIGQLPTSRVTPCRSFFNTGVDYAGSLTLKTFRG